MVRRQFGRKGRRRRRRRRARRIIKKKRQKEGGRDKRIMDKIDFIGPILRTIAKVVIPKKRYKRV